MKSPRMIAPRMKGMRTRNQATFLCPALQMEDNTNVQNNRYIARATRITPTFATSHSKSPTHNVLSFSTFCSMEPNKLTDPRPK